MANVMRPSTARVPGPYSDNAYIPTSTHGWVHANTWYASVPFNSAPPPAPAGINPQTWANGRWQPNPYFRPPPGMTQPPSAFPMWAPHPGWGTAVAGSQSWNPYRRKPNPGDKQYWETKLSDNPLMLENMHIKDDTPAEERHRKDSSNGVPHTPWVWVPKELSSDTSKSAENTGASASRDGQSGQRQYEQSQREPPSSASQAQRREQSSYDHTRTHSSSRNAYAPPATAHDASSQSRHHHHDAVRTAPSSHERVPSSAPPAVSTYSAYHQQQQQQRQQQEQERYQQDAQPQSRSQSQSHYQSSSDRYRSSSQQQEDSSRHQRQQSRDVSPRQSSYDSQAYPSSRDYRSGTTPASSASAAAAARQASTDSSASSASASNERDYRRDEAFSSRRELYPTFSPNIVRTPDHYNGSTARLPGRDDLERTPTRQPAATPSHGSIYAPPSNAPTRSNSLNAGRQSSQSTSAVISPNSSLGLLSFTEEPDSVLSPLIVPQTPPGASTSSRPSPHHEVSRSQTYPAAAYDDQQSYRKTPREYSSSKSRGPSRASSRERDRDRDWDRGDRRSYSRSRDVDATPQPGTRTPPAHTPPLSHYTRPSPDGRASAQPISRSHTYPAVVPPPPITPQRSRSPPRYSPSHGHSPSYSSYQHSSSASYARTSPNPATSSASYARTSPNPPTSSVSTAPSPLRHNPLPRPPQTSAYAEQLTRGSSSASAAAAAAAAQQQQQSTPRRTVRKGYWNRRGDHLYVSESGERFIVYAPSGAANPPELKHYPSPTEGWRDHHGNFIRYDPNVPELLDSLPLHGQSPRRPYHQFIQHVTV
ncbi:hypothetical protein OH77DRAFT_1470565 [Trametes cingulata]|nr:hypothetical protein OH77DRAFT_1470565 [Trametes cingulata]